MSKNVEITINNKEGIHARPSSMIVNCAQKFKCKILIKKGNNTGDAHNMLDIMAMGLSCGTKIQIICDGEDEIIALDEISELFGREFNFERK
jgi:phosphocarrier protein